MKTVAFIGAFTAIFAASIGLVQNDIKRVLAYSTVSQLGYMFLALGVGAFAAGVFHVFTHAFFKALLFLGAGSVIHAMSGEQDMRNMGDLHRRIPITHWTMFIATFAIAGIPPFAGFFSKDEILWQAWSSEGGAYRLLWLVGYATALMTAFYMFRLMFLTFHGQPRMSHEVEHHIHESPKSMTVPLIILAICAISAGWLGWPHSLGGSNRFEKFLEPVFAREAEVFQAEGEGRPAGRRPERRRAHQSDGICPHGPFGRRGGCRFGHGLAARIAMPARATRSPLRKRHRRSIHVLLQQVLRRRRLRLRLHRPPQSGRRAPGRDGIGRSVVLVRFARYRWPGQRRRLDYRAFAERFQVGGTSGSSTECWSMARRSCHGCCRIRCACCSGAWCSGTPW